MRKIGIRVEITTMEFLVKTDNIFLGSSMVKVRLGIKMFKVDILIVCKIINNWQLRDDVWIKMAEALETKIKMVTWTFWRNFDTIFTIGYEIAIKLKKWTIQLKPQIKIKTSLKNKIKVKIKWAWRINSKRPKISHSLKNSKINSIFKMQPRIIKAILLEWFKVRNNKKIKNKKMDNKTALNKWFHQMMPKVNLTKRINPRKKVINIWFCKWDKVTMSCKIKCLFNI